MRVVSHPRAPSTGHPPQSPPTRRPEVLPYRETSRCSKRLVGQDGWAGPRKTVPGVSSGHLSRPRPSPTFPDTARLPSALQFNVRPGGWWAARRSQLGPHPAQPDQEGAERPRWRLRLVHSGPLSPPLP